MKLAEATKIIEDRQIELPNWTPAAFRLHVKAQQTLKDLEEEIADKHGNPHRRNLAKSLRKAAEDKLKDLDKSMVMCAGLLQLGAEPGSIPRNWYYGFLPTRWGGLPVDYKTNKLDIPELPGVDLTKLTNGPVYVGKVPPECITKIKEAERIVGTPTRILVFSPNSEDFQNTYIPKPADPIALCYLEGIGWLRLCQWDLSKDLEKIPEDA